MANGGDGKLKFGKNRHRIPNKLKKTSVDWFQVGKWRGIPSLDISKERILP